MNHIFCKVACIILYCTLLNACSTKVVSPKPQTNPTSFQVSIDSWEGAPIEELVASWGEPLKIFTSHHNETKFYHYVREIKEPHLEAACRTSIEVSPDGTIDTSSAFFSEIYSDDATKQKIFDKEQTTYSSSCLWFNPWPARKTSEQELVKKTNSKNSLQIK